MKETKYIHELGTVIIVTETYIMHGDKVLMHKRSEDKKKFPGFWLGPGGHVDDGEDILTASIREVKEETGVIISEKDIKLKSIALHHHLDKDELYIVFIYLSRIPEHQKITDSLREGHSEWVAVNKLETMDKIFPPAKYYFDHVLNDKPGLLYTNIQWRDSQLVQVLSNKVDPKY